MEERDAFDLENLGNYRRSFPHPNLVSFIFIFCFTYFMSIGKVTIIRIND